MARQGPRPQQRLTLPSIPETPVSSLNINNSKPDRNKYIRETTGDAWLQVLNSKRFQKMKQEELLAQQTQRMLDTFPCLHCHQEKPCLRECPLTQDEWLQLGMLAADIQEKLDAPLPSGNPIVDKALAGLVYPFCSLDCQKMFEERKRRAFRP